MKRGRVALASMLVREREPSSMPLILNIALLIIWKYQIDPIHYKIWTNKSLVQAAKSKTLSQLLEFAKTVEKEVAAGGGVSGGDESLMHLKKRRGGARRKGSGGYWWSSGSLSDITAVSGGGVDGEERRNGAFHVEGIPAGLPRLQTLREGMATTIDSP
ncbi:hypothetical protein PIB30_007097 [Stylosanthes scabra]|uniref:Uncharacterized protein n=1 Tax=Stylosanthes scabra TaxID=79078 RepID=A0ABU6S3Z3_9FABA|nr:hypothetical protein [Stylosanthes scabra]